VVAIVTLLLVITISVIITRVAAVVLVCTGVSPDLAQFQARSAFTGVGFTTKEAERIVDHPVRRRVIMVLMFLGNAGIVTAISSLMLTFVGTEKQQTIARMAGLACGLLLLWALSRSRWVDRGLSVLTRWTLRRFTRLDIYDFSGLLRLSEGYGVSELTVEPGDWVAGHSLADLRLPDEGIQVLGIHRADGNYIGTPTGGTWVRRGDVVVLYGLSRQLLELDDRHAGAEGDACHTRRVEEHHAVVDQQMQRDLRVR